MVEPYTPHGFVHHRWSGEGYWSYQYSNYTGGYPWHQYVRGKDELDAYINALKHLNQLKRRARVTVIRPI